MMMKFTGLVWTVLFLGILLTQSITVESIGISPGRIDFDHVLRNGYAERTIKVSNDVPTQASVKVSEELKDWISFRPNATSFSVLESEPYLLTIIVQPPEEVPTGNYSGMIEIIGEGGGGVPGRAGGLVKLALNLAVDVEVSGDQVVQCRAGGIAVTDIEEQFPLDVSYTVINDGNVQLEPTVSVDVWDKFQENLMFVRTLNGKSILPTTEDDQLVRISNDLSQGQYWATIRIEECNVESIVTFSVVETGGIVDKGELRNIIAPHIIDLGDTAEVLANFANYGPRAVTAHFEGVVRRDDVLVSKITSEEVIIPSGEEQNIQMFFTPFDSGRHVVSGRVVYNKKLTFERAAIINVRPPTPIDDFDFTTLLLFIIIIITILFLLRKIHREKKRKHHPHVHRPR